MGRLSLTAHLTNRQTVHDAGDRRSAPVKTLLDRTIGLRVSPQEENVGLDISEHGMYGYPEQFIPSPELIGYGAVPASLRIGTGPLSDPDVTA